MKLADYVVFPLHRLRLNNKLEIVTGRETLLSLTTKGMLLLLPLLLLGACTTTRPISTQPHIDNLVLSPELSTQIRPLSFVLERTPKGQLLLQTQLENASPLTRTIRYQVTWFDERGLVLGPPIWSSRLVQSRETLEIRIIAPYAQAATGRLHITD